MNFFTDVVLAQPAERVALVELTAAGERREWSFAEVVELAESLSTHLAGRGVGRGDVVMTLIGSRPEWVGTMLACLRIGAVALPMNEQLRAHDIELRIAAAAPKLLLYDERNAGSVAAVDAPGVVFCSLGEKQTTPGGPGPGASGRSERAERPPPADLEPGDPCLIVFTSGTSGEAKGVLHGQRYWQGQALQAEHWLGAREGDVVWCTAASGWSKSARNVFWARWWRGATALIHDGRFDPAERLDIIEREGVNVLCMAPTEYRTIAKRVELRELPSLRELVAAGEALNPEVLGVWERATGLEIRDGYGQSETGQLTAAAVGERPQPGSMGAALPGVRLWIDEGELVADPRSVPTFFLRYLGEEPPDPDEPWRTGDRVRQDEDGRFYFEGRSDDVIISAGYRIGPFEVESALVAHPAVVEAAVVAAPDEMRGSVVRAVVVLGDGVAPSEALVRELQQHVREQTAPYKYPRIVDFAAELPKTRSGKVRRAVLRS